jgi:hypothetical protein
MVIPIRILYTIRISILQKLSVGIVRVISLNSSVKEGSLTTLWSVIEAAVGNLISITFSVHMEPHADSMLIALMVRCLPSFAIFIRGRVEVSRVQYFDTSPIVLSRTHSHTPPSEAKSHTRVGSFVMEDDVERERASSNGRSDNVLVDIDQLFSHKDGARSGIVGRHSIPKERGPETRIWN